MVLYNRVRAVTTNPDTITRPDPEPTTEPVDPARDETETQPDPGVGIEPAPKEKWTLFERFESFLERLSSRNAFWHRVCSLIWLPYAFRSGITMKRADEHTFKATLPFRRFNKNWYNAMAGAALLGNSEIAGGSYVFGVCGGAYTVVCKQLEYKFLRPCFGPAEYRITPLDDIHELVATGKEFNISVRMDIVQVLPELSKSKRVDAESDGADAAGATGKRLKRDKRVGRCNATFHATPKTHHKKKSRRHAGEQ